VPTKLVPAVGLRKGETIIWESKEILLALEEEFPDAPPLLPAPGPLRDYVSAHTWVTWAPG